MFGIQTITASTKKARLWRGAPWSRCRSTGGCLAMKASDSSRWLFLEKFTLLGGMMVDRTDIAHLLSATTSIKIAPVLREVVYGAICARQVELSDKFSLPALPGQRPGRPASAFIARPRCGHLDAHDASKNCPRCRRPCDIRDFGIGQHVA